MADATGWSITRLDWDSTFWAREVGTARPDRDAEALDAGRLASSQLDLVYALCASGDLAEVRHAEAAGFRAVDLRCTVVGDAHASRTALTARIGIVVGVAAGADVAAAAALAATVHTNTRFANDPLLDRDRVAALYRRWIERDAEVPGWELLVARDRGEVSGYVTHGPAADGSGTIGLIGVGADARGRGLGRSLLAAAMTAEAEAGRRLLRVVTHGGDTASMAMYQAAGFTVESLQVWLHWHRPR